MDHPDRAYFYRRAETELALSQQAVHPAAVHAHYELANLYLDAVYPQGFEKRPPGE